MTFLLAKYTLLFLLAAAFGFALGYWWSRRNFVDVSESYSDLRKANQRSDAGHWDRLWQRLDEFPDPKETDLSEVESRLQAISTLITDQPRPEPVSFAAIENRLDSLKQSILDIPQPEKPTDPDFRPLTDRLDSLKQSVLDIPQPEKPTDPDFRPLTERLDRIDADIMAIPVPEAPPRVDLAPIDRRLQGIETELGQLRQRLVQPKPARDTQQKSTPTIIKAALYGKKDDLKRISGVGPKLEKLLNKNGVYYYWQVASWTPRDITVIDDRLDVFKGRISRDEWVKQAQKLKKQPGAASMPG